MGKKLNMKVRCTKCNETLERVFVFGLMQDAGAKVYGVCSPKEHEWDGPLWIDEEEE